MEEQIMIFEGKKVEIFEWKGMILFNPKDVATCLDITDVNSSMRKFSDKQLIKLKNSDMHIMHNRKLNNAGENFLTESGVYKLIFKSQKKEAEEFQDWVTDVVLPDIRRNGMYATKNTIEDMLDNPDMMITLLTKYKEEKEERRKLELENSQKNELLIIAGERTSLIDDFLQASDIYSIDTVSKILAIKGMGRNNLYKYLREKKILMTDTYIDGKGVSKGGMKHFTAYASYTNDKCYFKHRTRDMQLRGEIVKQNVAMFTPIGVEWIYKKLIKDGWIQAKTLEEIIKELSKSEVA